MSLLRPPARSNHLVWAIASALVVLLFATPTVLGVGPPGTSGAPHAALPSTPASTPPLGPSRHVAPAAASPGASITLSAPGRSPSAVSLAWTATTDAIFYNYTVAFSTVGASGPWRTAAVLSSSQATTQDAFTDLSPGATTWWQVTSYGFLATTPSNVLPVTQPTLAYLNVTLKSASSAEFNWTNNATYGGEVTFGSYSLYESVTGSSPTVVGTVNNVNATSLTIAGISPSTYYQFFLVTTDCLSACTGGPADLVPTDSNSVTLGTPASLTASIVASRTFVDAGQLDLFTCTPSGGAAPFEFAWNLGNGTFVPGASSLSSSFSANGSASANVVVTCRVTDALATSSTTAVTVTVEPDPVVNVSASPTSLDAAEPGVFLCSASGGLSPYVVSWSFGDGSSASGGSTDHTYVASGSFVATCSVVDVTSTQATASLTVNVSPPMRVTVTASAGSAAPGTTLTFTGVAVNGSAPYTKYAWNFGDGSSSTSADTTHAFVADGNYSVALTVTDTNGVSVSNSTLVHVTTLLASATASERNGTAGDTVTFIGTASGGAGAPYNFTWSFGDGTVGYGANATHRYADSGTYYPTLNVTDRLGAKHSIAISVIRLSAPAAPAPWLTAPLILLIAILVGVVAGVLEYARRRRARAQTFPSVAGRVPATDPARTVRGSKVCRVCGTVNLPIRETCDACGASLRRAIQR